jgi:hypothetical protein
MLGTATGSALFIATSDDGDDRDDGEGRNAVGTEPCSYSAHPSDIAVYTFLHSVTNVTSVTLFSLGTTQKYRRAMRAREKSSRGGEGSLRGRLEVQSPSTTLMPPDAAFGRNCALCWSRFEKKIENRKFRKVSRQDSDQRRLSSPNRRLEVSFVERLLRPTFPGCSQRISGRIHQIQEAIRSPCIFDAGCSYLGWNWKTIPPR